MARVESSQVWMGVLGVLLVVFGPGTSIGQAGDEAQDVPWQAVHQAVARSFVVVQYHLQKSDRPSEGDSRYGSEQRVVLEHILDKNTIETVGVIISDTGEVFTLERQPQLSDVVRRITVRGWDGAVVPAQADRLLAKALGRVVRMTEAMPEAWRALSFAEMAETPTPETEFLVVAMGIDEQHHITIRPCSYGLNWGEAATGHCLLVPSFYHVGVLCDTAGHPVGVTIQRKIDLGPAGPIWRGQDILADPGISEETQRQLEDRLEQEFAENVYEITVTFRPESREEGYGSRGGYGNDGPYSRRGGQERLLYGPGLRG